MLNLVSPEAVLLLIVVCILAILLVIFEGVRIHRLNSKIARLTPSTPHQHPQQEQDTKGEASSINAYANTFGYDDSDERDLRSSAAGLTPPYHGGF